MVPKKKTSDSNINAGTPKQYPELTVKIYQSLMVSMSSSTSRISSGPTNVGTHKSSTAQGSWRRFLDLLIIRSWRVAQIDFQCRLAQFRISNKGVLRC
jgi:hypothetical protein